ncbi:hypothetical protein HCU64_19580 [Methylobacterium sp. C25]|uniref:hypothetical protein n=1 Tax=Methylobacterium sp. C25 TaxID=2721622 RepID=UPI001F1A69D4|nr:hypothetical protein [Methylobacterium sp. C25]MCE4225956.1 hypothetical protein [Methylobacterium sp. C25]
MPTRHLDPARLKSDVARLRETRSPALAPGSRRLTGAMAVVRHHLDLLQRLHAEGATWVDLAAGLAAQGVTQSHGAALTGRRLTALIASVERQDRRRAAREAERLARADLVRPVCMQAPAKMSSPVRLAAELTRPAIADEKHAALSDTEDVIRRRSLEHIQELLKKD